MGPKEISKLIRLLQAQKAVASASQRRALNAHLGRTTTNCGFLQKAAN
jgi:hypothetical protein